MYFLHMCVLYSRVYFWENLSGSVTFCITSPLRNENNYVSLTGKQVLPKSMLQG